MRPVLGTTLLAVGLLVPAAPRAAAQVSIQFQWGTRQRPLEGRRFEAMRALAHELDGRAEHARDEVAANAGRSRSDRRLLGAVDDFARRAADFHARMDNYEARPWDLPPEVGDLRARALNINERFQRVPAFQEHVYDDWSAALDVLGRMDQVLRGYAVDVPPPSRWDHDRDYDEHRQGWQRWYGQQGELPNAGYADPRYAQSGYARSDGGGELRDLAARMVETASRLDQEIGRHWQDPFGDRHAASLSHLVDLARQIQRDVDRDPRAARDTVQHLQADLRSAEPHLRATTGLSQAAPEWTQMERMADRMDQLTR